MKVFLDTNVVVDFCARREPFFQSAAMIIDMGLAADIGLAISSLTFINVAYIVRKAFGKDIVYDKLKALSELCEITEIDEAVIHSAIAKRSTDFEDNVQWISAQKADAEIIITRDKKGFQQCPLPVNTPDEFIAACQS